VAATKSIIDTYYFIFPNTDITITFPMNIIIRMIF
jgi:hypothetical protein